MGLFLFSSVSGKIIHNNVKTSVRICKIAADCKYIFEWGGGGVLKNQCVMVSQLGLGRAGLHAWVVTKCEAASHVSHSG